MIKVVQLLSVECDSRGLTEGAAIVRRGGLVAYPTDTLYGLGCDPYREDSIRRLIELKRRERRHLPVLCSSMQDAERLVNLGELGRNLAVRYWPGGLTIVAEVSSKDIPRLLTGVSGRLGVRVPNHKCALKLISLCGGSLVGTSANISGSPPLKTAEEVAQVFGGGLDVLVYCGERPLGIPSTVVDVSGGRLKVLREGLVSSEEIHWALNQSAIY